MKHNCPTLIDLFSDERNGGFLGAVETRQNCGFTCRRVYYIHGELEGKERGCHGHKRLEQFLVVLKGQVEITLEGATGVHTFVIKDTSQGLYIPAGYWRVLDKMTNDTVVMVMASDPYDEEDYLRNYDEFKDWLEDQSKVSSVSYLNFDRMHYDLRFDLDCAHDAVMESCHYINGPHLSQFENDFAKYCQGQHCVGVANGLQALEIILRGWGVTTGDEVIVAENSYIATVLAVSAVGAKPVLAKMDEKTFSIDASAIESMITEKTKAIALTHLYGIPAQMNMIMDIAKRYNIKVLEDSAQAHGATIEGKPVGAIGDAGAFSFYPTKNLGAYGDGGAIVTNDSNLAEFARKYRDYGQSQKYKNDIIGTNSRLDELQAAFLTAKLKRLESWNEKRQRLAEIYFNELAGVQGLCLPEFYDKTQPVWHVFSVRITNEKRDALQRHLQSKGVGTNIHYPIPVDQQECYAELKGVYDTKCSAKWGDEVLSLPLDPYHTEAEIKFVCKHIREFF